MIASKIHMEINKNLRNSLESKESRLPLSWGLMASCLLCHNSSRGGWLVHNPLAVLYSCVMHWLRVWGLAKPYFSLVI